jgi:alpha-amylase
MRMVCKNIEGRPSALSVLLFAAMACGPKGNAADKPTDDREASAPDGFSNGPDGFSNGPDGFSNRPDAPSNGSDGFSNRPDAPSNTPDASSLSDRGASPSPEGATPELRGPGSVFVHLFEWKWTDIAMECESYLGPAGFSAVQVSPPSEHAVLPGRPWWQRYQTVSYSLAKSRSGTAEEFRDMVRRCGAVGVSIYVDAVINHMTGQASGVGSNGTSFTKYEYPGLYTAADFHMPTCTIAAADYQNAADRVQSCELVGLADLNTASDHVREQIATYLSSLVEMGVRGFRIDAAKHIAPADLDAIIRRVSGRVAASSLPYYFFEVIDYGGEAIHATDYLQTGQGAAASIDVTEFKFSGIGNSFLNTQGNMVADLRSLGETSWGLLPSNRAVVFVDNHDTERATAIFYQNAPYYDLAVAFMLAWPYGYPSILSGFAFDRATQVGRDSGPPSDAMGNTRPVYAPGAASPDCSSDPVSVAAGWLCEHRRPYVARMISFRKSTSSAPSVTNVWNDGANQLAFGRGDKGFVVFNRSAGELHRVFQTGLRAGTYCDVFQGATSASGGCSGATVTVDGGGMADITAPALGAIAIHVGAPAAP